MNEQIDVARQRARDGSRLLGQFLCRLLLCENGASRYENATWTIAEFDQAVDNRPKDFGIASADDIQGVAEPIGRGLETFVQGLQEVRIGDVGGFGEESADQVGLDAELGDGSIVEQLRFRETAIGRYGRGVAQTPIARDEEQRRVVKDRRQPCDQTPMQFDRPFAAVGQLAPERDLIPDGLVESVEHRGKLAARFPDPGNEPSRDARIGGVGGIPFKLYNQPVDHLLLCA
ncbi:MAG: hypothetical protein WD626_03115 [Bauldia sp.]